MNSRNKTMRPLSDESSFVECENSRLSRFLSFFFKRSVSAREWHRRKSALIFLANLSASAGAVSNYEQYGSRENKYHQKTGQAAIHLRLIIIVKNRRTHPVVKAWRKPTELIVGGWNLIKWRSSGDGIFRIISTKGRWAESAEGSVWINLTD
jgi:hypothetical protein